VTVYKLTIMHTVEERIFDLQEKKRKLAEAAIEGKSVAKLSMKDILNLFKHDNHGHDDPSDGRNAELGAKPRVLQSTGVPAQMSSHRQAASAQGGTPEARKPRVPEHSVFGRRW
jgi:hypothetical protein